MFHRRAVCCAALGLVFVASACGAGGNSPNAGTTRVRATELSASKSTATVPTTTPPTSAAAAAPAPTTTPTQPATKSAPVVAPPPSAPAPVAAPPAAPSITIAARANGVFWRNDNHRCSNGSAQSLTRGECEVRRTGSTSGALSVAYRVAGTSSDFAPLSGAVTIPPGAASAVIGVVPTIVEAPAPVHVHRSSTVTVTLVDGASYDLGAASAAITLRFDIDQFGCERAGA